MPEHVCLCIRSFSLEPNMLRHLNSVHLKTRPFRCSFVQKGFQEKKVKRHERIHLRNEQDLRSYEGLGSDALLSSIICCIFAKISEKRMKEQQSAKLAALDILLDKLTHRNHFRHR